MYRMDGVYSWPPHRLVGGEVDPLCQDQKWVTLGTEDTLAQIIIGESIAKLSEPGLPHLLNKNENIEVVTCRFRRDGTMFKMVPQITAFAIF